VAVLCHTAYGNACTLLLVQLKTSTGDHVIIDGIVPAIATAQLDTRTHTTIDGEVINLDISQAHGDWVGYNAIAGNIAAVGSVLPA
jgi:hypothetical protein